MRRAALVCCLLWVLAPPAMAGGPFRALTSELGTDSILGYFDADPSEVPQENHRAVAIGLAALLGPFGAHRLYLGTTPKVAIIYGLTFGGFGVLVLVDLVHLIAAKDLDRFRNSDKVIMWGSDPTPP